jgi:hypothetical protein
LGRLAKYGYAVTAPYLVNNDPLIVVDGMAYGGSINDINPANIASVDILKGRFGNGYYMDRAVQWRYHYYDKTRSSNQRPLQPIMAMWAWWKPLAHTGYFNGLRVCTI